MTGTDIAYYFACKRKLWLSNKNLNMEQNSENVALGKVISENSYHREKHEIKIGNIVIDFFDSKTNTINEVKKSDRMEELHFWQVKYYIKVLTQKGIPDVKGKIDYPKLRKTAEVFLTEEDSYKLDEIEKEIGILISQTSAPPVINASFCKKCAYYEFCYI